MFLRCLALLAAASPVASAEALLDPSFGSAGSRTLFYDQPETSERDLGTRVFTVAGGKLVVVGQSDIDAANALEVGITLARLMPDGELDATFSGGGSRVHTPGLWAVHDAAVGALGKILVAGEENNDSTLLRYFSDGEGDITFAFDGDATWDASGLGTLDRAQAVAEIDGKLFAAGQFDSDPTVLGLDYDVYVATVDPNSGTATVFARDELAGAAADTDRVAGLVLQRVGVSGSPTTLAVLADNDSPGYAGTVTVFDAASTARLRTIRLEGLLTPAAGCAADATLPRSTALVRMSNTYGAVIGNLTTGGSVFRQSYVIVYNALDGQVASARCGPLNQPTTVEEGVVSPTSRLFGGDLHLAVTSNVRNGYWRWALTLDDEGEPTFAPDPLFNGGQPIRVPFDSITGTAPSGFARGIALDDSGRAVVVGSTQYERNDAGLDDWDVALFRVHASETVHADGFEEEP